MKKVLFIITPLLIAAAFCPLGYLSSVSGGYPAVSISYAAVWAIYLTVVIRERFIPGMAISAVYWWLVLEISLLATAVGFSSSLFPKNLTALCAVALMPFIAAYPPENQKMIPAYIAVAVSVIFALISCVAAGICSGSGIFVPLLALIPLGAMAAGILMNAGGLSSAVMAELNGSDPPEAQPAFAVMTVIFLLAWLITIAAAIYRANRSSGIAAIFAVFWGITGLSGIGFALFPDLFSVPAVLLLSPLYGLSPGPADALFGFVCFAASFIMCALSVCAWLLFFGKKDGVIENIGSAETHS